MRVLMTLTLLLVAALPLMAATATVTGPVTVPTNDAVCVDVTLDIELVAGDLSITAPATGTYTSVTSLVGGTGTLSLAGIAVQNLTGQLLDLTVEAQFGTLVSGGNTLQMHDGASALLDVTSITVTNGTVYAGSTAAAATGTVTNAGAGAGTKNLATATGFAGDFTVDFGASLTVPAGVPSGTYVGTLTLCVDVN